MIRKFASPRLSEIKAQIKTLKAEAKELTLKGLNEGFAAIFESYPELEGFKWHQYTPFFNDGEECVFGVNFDDVTLIIDGEEYEQWNDELTDEQETMRNACASLLYEFEESYFKKLFGDHMEITVTRNGIEKNGYDHD